MTREFNIRDLVSSPAKFVPLFARYKPVDDRRADCGCGKEYDVQHLSLHAAS
jgi:hypothetical protein